MVIVGGSFELDPGERDQFIASRVEMMRGSRGEDGCLEYTFAADPLDDGRVILFERWVSQAHLDAHLAGLRAKPNDDAPAVRPKSASIMMYDISDERPFGR